MTQLIFVRHGETAWNNEAHPRYQGQLDIPLSDKGREQARRVAQRLAGMKLAALYTSDLSRALETAQIIGRMCRLTAISDARWREANLGRWQGLTYHEVQQLYPDEARQRYENPGGFTPPGAEPATAVAQRCRAAVDEIVSQWGNAQVAIVTSGGPIRVILCHLLHLPYDVYWRLRVDNGSLTAVDVYPDGAILTYLNDTCHIWSDQE